MTLEYVVKRTGKTSDAVISSGGVEVARIKREAGKSFELEAAGDRSWKLNPRVKGEIKPFSMEVTSSEAPRTPVLTILNHLFEHGSRFYMLMGVPERVHPKDHVLGGRYIVRLDKFPFSNLDEVDRETWGRPRLQRGTQVGEIDGLGLEGHTVKLSDELREIALPLAASSYLLYSTA